jgi:uncharacterized C2H2 Zn-finger protein
MGKKINARRVSAGKRKGKTWLGKPKCRWVYNIKKKYFRRVLAGYIWIRKEKTGRLL